MMCIAAPLCTLQLFLPVRPMVFLHCAHFPNSLFFIYFCNFLRVLMLTLFQLPVETQCSLNNTICSEVGCLMHSMTSSSILVVHPETSASLPSEALLSGQVEAHMRYSALDAKRPPSESSVHVSHSCHPFMSTACLSALHDGVQRSISFIAWQYVRNMFGSF